jgi:hypothetical protein
MKNEKKSVSALGSLLLLFLGVFSVSACYYWLPNSVECQSSNYYWLFDQCPETGNAIYAGNRAGPKMDAAFDDYGDGTGTDLTIKNEPLTDCVYTIFWSDCAGDPHSMLYTNHNYQPTYSGFNDCHIGG